MFTQTRRTALVLVGIMVVSILISAMIVAAPVASARTQRDEPKKTTRIRFADKDIDSLTKAISEAGKQPQKVVHVSSPPPRHTHVPLPQPTYTPRVSSNVVTVRNATNWYILVNIDDMGLNLYPGGEQDLSWTYTGRGHYVEAEAYLDPYHQESVGTYQGNLVGYQIPWRLNFDYGSFTVR